MSQAITVTGIGSASAPPDIATVDVGVGVQAASVRSARAKAASDTEAVMDALANLGIAGPDLATSAFSIRPVQDKREGRRLRGYRVVNTLAATVRDLDKLGAVIDAAVAAAADSTIVTGVRFGHQSPTSLEAEARAAAWDDARRKARELAELAGLRLGHANAIAEHGSPTPLQPVRAMALESAPATPIETGELSVTISINVEFSISSA